MMRHFITRRVAISMLFIGLTMLGYISYRFLPVELLPEVEPPTLIIAVSSAREVDPTQLEREAILPLEEAAGLLAGIQEIESFANRQSGTIRLSFRNTVDIKYAYLRLQERVQAVIPNIPVTYNVTVEKVLQGDLNQIFLTLQVRGEGDVDALRNLAELKIVPELEAIDGIASVILAGGRQRSVEIILDDDAADAYNLTASRLRGLLGNNNQDKTFVGRVRHYQKSYFVNVSAEYQAVSDIGQLVVDPVGPVLLRDIAEIRDGFKEETEISRVNGKSSVTIQLFKDSQANLLHLGDLTHPVLARLNRNLASEEVEIAVQQDPSEILRDNMDLLVNLSLTGALAAMVVLWFFLRHLPLVVMIGVALPISIFTAFNIFYGFGITLNALTMVGLALAVGMLLDNSVVVLENIYRLAQQGLKPLEAALQGTREVWRSILATTLTTVSVFLPFSFAQEFGIKVLGEQVGISIIGTLLVSLLVALLLIPMGAYALLTWRPDVPRQFRISSKRSPAVHRYTVILKAAMRYPIRVIIASLLIFFLSLVLVLTANSQGATESLDRNLTLYLTMGSGATLESTDRAMVELEKALEGIDEVESFVSQVYAEEGVVTLNLKENFEDLADRDAGAVKSDINRRIAEFRMGDVSFDQPATGGRFSGMGGRATQNFQAMLGTATNPERVVLKGQDLAVMNALADDIANQLEDLNEIRFARVNTARSRPELHLNFNQVLLSRYNVPYGNIIGELNSFQPEVSTGISYRDGTEDIDITLRNPLPDPEDKQRTVPELRRLTIPASNGDFYQLEALSDFVFTEGEGGVRRFNQERQVELTYRFEDEINASSTLLEEARASVEDLVNQFNIPEGIAVEVIHEENDASDFYMLGILAFVLVFLILASVFESLVNPWVILFTIPLAAIGTFIALLVTGEPLLSNYTVYVGMLILLGIIVNNGIILIDYARQLRQRGFRIQRALLVAGQARLRPILITAITTIVGMLPLAMGKAESITQIAAPFAITVIGGLGFGTLLTLILIPTVYMGLEDLLRWLRNLPLSTRLTQLILLLAGFAYIYFEVDSLYWQSVDLLVLLTLLPAATYFIRSSLRRTSTRLIPADTPLRIRLHYLYKLYGRPPRFRREWQRTPRLPAWSSRKEATDHLWHLGIWGFLIYFTYFFLHHRWWQMVLAIAIYLYTQFLYHRLRPLFEGWTGKVPRFLARHAAGLLRWGIPLTNLLLFAFTWDAIARVIVLAILWLGAIFIHNSARRIDLGLVDIHRPEGRFKGMKRAYYRLVKRLPLIGHRPAPFRALQGVSLDIGNGMFGLLGPNGAGKTTLMRILCGILDQSYGASAINQYSLDRYREELQGLIGYLPQDFGTYETMSARQYLHYQALLKNIKDPEEREKRVTRVIQAVNLTEQQDVPIKGFSGGMKQRVGIAQTLLHLPRILVVDEPTAGLDPRERIRFRNLLVELSQDRIVVFSTHVIEDIASSCDRVAVMNRGEVRFLGSPREMARQADGKVWQFDIAPQELDLLREKLTIVHHQDLGEQVLVRCLSATAPTPSAVAVQPSLEDAYLWILGRRSPESEALSGS